jgi:hypothetical protein
LLLADKKGWKYLATAFADLANRRATSKMRAGGDPDDHAHLGYEYTPVNKALSHRFEFRLGILDSRTRVATLAKYKIKKSSESADLQLLFKQLIHAATKAVREDNRLTRRIATPPGALDNEFHTMFGMKLPEPRPTRKKRKLKS